MGNLREHRLSNHISRDVSLYNFRPKKKNMKKKKNEDLKINHHQRYSLKTLQTRETTKNTTGKQGKSVLFTKH